MVHKYVYFVYPLRKDKVIATEEVKIPDYERSIYDAVGHFEDKIFKKSKYSCYKRKLKCKIELKKIINLHDEDGLDIKKINVLLKSLYCGNHLLSQSYMPNIKLIQTDRKEWVVFDGHHSLNSYMMMNKKFLDEVPHLVVLNDSGFFDDKAIGQFYGKHKKEVNDKDWRDYVINWNYRKDNQLKKRKRKNMLELNTVIKNQLVNV